MANKDQFRVIIAGGGIVGLALANLLEHVNIDFILLEKREIAPRIGASISILGHVSKILERLGILDDMLIGALPLQSRQHFDENGRLFEDSKIFSAVLDITNRPILFVERHHYLDCLYDHIRDKSKIRADTGVVSFDEDDEGVTVVTDKNEQLRGNLLVGADGVHSTVRKLMATKVFSTDPSRYEKLTNAFTINFRALFGTSPNNRDGDDNDKVMPEATVQNVYYRGISGSAATGVKDLVFWFLYIKEDSPISESNSPRYTEADAADTIKKFGDLAMGPGYDFKYLWDTKKRATMVSLEQGVLQGGWNNGGRVVLAGDAAFKAQPHTGLSGNTGVEGAWLLCNELASLLSETPNPATEQVTAALDRYEKNSRPRAERAVTLSSYVARFEAMDTWWLRMLRPLSPWVPDAWKARLFVDFITQSPAFKI